MASQSQLLTLQIKLEQFIVALTFAGLGGSWKFTISLSLLSISLCFCLVVFFLADTVSSKDGSLCL